MIERLRELDGLRGLAILCVLGGHAVTPLVPAAFGVTLFFAISGFIITRLLLEDSRLLPFYTRRFFRLMPALAMYVAACFALLLLLGERVFWSDLYPSLFYYANYKTPVVESMRTLWSLAVEEHFYLLFPPLVLLLRGRTEMLQRVLIGVIFASLAWRIFLVSVGYAYTKVGGHTDSRLDSLAFGCLLSVLIHRADANEGPRRFLDMLGNRWSQALALGMLFLSFAIRSEDFRQSLRYSLQGASFAIVFCCLFWSHSAYPPVVRLLRSRWLVYVGTVSYSLYLYHEFGLIVGRHVTHEYITPRTALVTFAVTIPVTLLSFYLVETPCRRFGARLARKLSQAAPANVDGSLETAPAA